MIDRARQCIVCGISLAGRHGSQLTCSVSCSGERRRQRSKKSYWADPNKARERARSWKHKQGASRQRAWRKLNPEKTAASSKRWRQANPEKVRAQKRKWYWMNRDGVLEQRRNHYPKIRSLREQQTVELAAMRELELI